MNKQAIFSWVRALACLALAGGTLFSTPARALDVDCKKIANADDLA